ncbi:MAG: response regulator [Flavobacteriales bacterium]|nr:response regulator [Flavobacteriales bacterium]
MTEFIKLTDEQIVVKSAESVEEALELLAQSEDQFPEVIYVDLNMPVFNGFDFIESFEKMFFVQHPDCSLYMLSSSLRPEDRSRAAQYPSVRDFVSKSDIDQFLPETLKREIA